MSAKGSRGPWLLPLIIAATGIILLLSNFLLIGDFRITTLWPLLLVLAGAVILLRGDLVPSGEGRTFGITRGSVESATLEISSGAIDVQVRALAQEGRLIAGQYAFGSRPAMSVSETHAHLKLARSATPWLSFADWQLSLARDLPWYVLISTHLGQVSADLSNVIIGEATVATGLGDIRLVCPSEALGPIRVQSALGNIHIITPIGCRARLKTQNSRLFRVHADQRRYEQTEPGIYEARDAGDDARLVDIVVHGTFGDAYLT